MRLGGHVARVEVQSGDGVGALGFAGLLLDGDSPAPLLELHDAVKRSGRPRGKPKPWRGPTRRLHGARQVARQAVAVEDVVAGTSARHARRR